MSASKKLDVVPRRARTKGWRWFMRNIPSKKEIKGNLRKKAKRKLFMSYGNAIFAFSVRIGLPLIRHKTEKLIFCRAFILSRDAEEIGQLCVPCLLAS